MSRRRAPRAVGELLAPAVEQAAPQTPLAEVQRVWLDAVGEPIAREASPVSERDGIVTVACNSSTWAQELDLLAGQIERKLRARLPSETGFERLRFTATGE